VNTLLIVDDHVLFREGLKELISHWHDFIVVGEASNGLEAVEQCQDLLPDIVLMDINMPGMGGVESTRQIRIKSPSVRVIVLTMSSEEKHLFEALKNGAQGYILKDTPVRRLHDSLRGVMNNEVPISGVIAAKLLEEFKETHWAKDLPMAARLEPLTERERYILGLVAEGLSNAEIGERLFLSEQTVKKQLSNVLQKLHLNNRVQLAVYAVREGLLD
jgi:DNA-binding NarL/FixJ family response regulator